MISNSIMISFTGVIWMTDKFTAENLTAENFKEFVLDIERNNLKQIDKEEKKGMVSKIIRTYEEAKKNGNK